MVRSVDDISPPMMTMANGRCVSEPMACDSAAGRRPSDASSAVISTGRSRCDTASQDGVLRLSSRALLARLAHVGDEQDAVHHRHAEQGDEADRRRHRQHRVGQIEREDAAHRGERHDRAAPPAPAAPRRTSGRAGRRSRSIEIGTITIRRFMARRWFSNSPPQVR